MYHAKNVPLKIQNTVEIWEKYVLTTATEDLLE
jgi:hypothetical protein